MHKGVSYTVYQSLCFCISLCSALFLSCLQRRKVATWRQLQTTVMTKERQKANHRMKQHYENKNRSRILQTLETQRIRLSQDISSKDQDQDTRMAIPPAQSQQKQQPTTITQHDEWRTPSTSLSLSTSLLTAKSKSKNLVTGAPQHTKLTEDNGLLSFHVIPSYPESHVLMHKRDTVDQQTQTTDQETAVQKRTVQLKLEYVHCTTAQVHKDKQKQQKEPKEQTEERLIVPSTLTLTPDWCTTSVGFQRHELKLDPDSESELELSESVETQHRKRDSSIGYEDLELRTCQFGETEVSVPRLKTQRGGENRLSDVVVSEVPLTFETAATATTLRRTDQEHKEARKEETESSGKFLLFEQLQAIPEEEVERPEQEQAPEPEQKREQQIMYGDFGIRLLF